MKKYDFAPFDKKYIDERVFDYLNRAKKICFKIRVQRMTYYQHLWVFMRNDKPCFHIGERLQDIPMLQVINKYSDFAEYLFIV